MPRKFTGKEKSRSARDIYNRRELKKVELHPPSYSLSNPAILAESYIEMEVTFAGIIEGVRSDLDTTSRTDVLRIIDKGKRDGKLPWRTNMDHDAIFTLCAHDMKLSKRDGHEEIIIRVAIHEIEAVSYIRDDNQHILTVKYGDPEGPCHLIVLLCESKMGCEQLCSLMGQCFELAYTDATLQGIELSYMDGTSSVSSFNSSNITSSTTTSKSERSDSNRSTPVTPRPDQYGFRTESVQNLHTKRKTSAESELSGTAVELLQQYTKKLQTKLNVGELQQFAQLLRAWHTGIPFHEFCDKVLELYGPERKYLLLGMRPFIPDKDYTYFESYLERVGLSSNGTWSDSVSSNPGNVKYG